MLGEFRVFVAEADAPDARRRVKIREAEADFSQGGYAVASAIDGKPETGWAVAAEFGRDHAAIFRLSRPIAAKAGTRLVIELDQQFMGGNHLLGKFRLSATDADGPLTRPAHPAAWRPLLAARELSAAERSKLLGYYLQTDGEYRSLKEAEQLLSNPRLAAVQDLAWALINSPAFLFNH